MIHYLRVNFDKLVENQLKVLIEVPFVSLKFPDLKFN